MRRTLQLINGVTLREIRVCDLANALTQLLENGDRAVSEVTGEQWDNALLLNMGLITGKVTEEVMQAFIDLNACFFSPEKKNHSQMGQAKKISTIEAELNSVCVALIELGHRDCWQYGWQFFLAAQESFKHE